MQLATWNVNSLGVRLPQVLDWLAAHPVDVLALQELKLTDDKFPAQAFADAGYQAQWFGQKTYNGVALISRTPATDVVKNIPGFADEQSRVLCATIDGIHERVVAMLTEGMVQLGLLAGVIAAMFVPLKDRFGKSPLHSLEHGLEPYVKFLIVPLFAFGNAGVVLTGITLQDFAAPLPMGIAFGLLLGKLIGVFGMTWLLVKTGIARLPRGANWQHVFGVALLAGIGFTMSLFIGSLSYDDLSLMNDVRLGVLSGSVVAAVLGYLVLRAAGPGTD